MWTDTHLQQRKASAMPYQVNNPAGLKLLPFRVFQMKFSFSPKEKVTAQVIDH